MSYTALDVLKYHAAIGWSQIEWATDHIGGNAYFELSEADASRLEDVLDKPLEVIRQYVSDILDSIIELEPGFTIENGHYSDGRPVRSGVWVEQGIFFSHTWHYDTSKAAQEPYKVRGGSLGADPGQYAGSYDIKINPTTQTVEAEVFKSTFVYYTEPVAAVANLVANVGLGEFTGEFGPEKIALDIGDSVARRTVYLDPEEAMSLADSLTAHADGAKKAAEKVDDVQ